MRRLILQKQMLAVHRRGVPYSVLMAPFPDNIDRLMSVIELPGRNQSEPSVIYDKHKQKNYVEGLKKVILSDDIRSTGKLMVFSARDIDHLPGQLALSLAAFVVEHGKKFIWHNLYGGVKDELREDLPRAQERLKDTSLFILGNLAENSTAMKVEKARDLLVQHAHLNRIIVTAGMNPAEYAKNVLRMRCDAFVYF